MYSRLQSSIFHVIIKGFSTAPHTSPKNFNSLLIFRDRRKQILGQRVIGISSARDVSTNRAHHVITGQALRTSMVGLEVRVLRDS